MKAVICGSDYHLADFGAVPPLIPGHEGAGVIEAVRDKNVLVIGDGPFGFLHAWLAGILGAKSVLVMGHHDVRLSRTRLFRC